MKERHLRDPRKELLRAAYSRAKRQGVPFSLSLNDVFVPEFCPVFGMPLRVGTRQNHDASPSLDKIVPALGYVKGNVNVISWRANDVRGNATVEELEKVLAYVRGLKC